MTKNQMERTEDYKQYLIPIVIGVTGHRDLIDEEIHHLEQAVRSLIIKIKNTYKESPLMVLSPLAEGADRLVARVALELGAQLVVPLPMKREEYEKDFETEESKAEFQRFISQSEWWFELPLLKERSLKDIQENQQARDEQYAYLGSYIASNSQILIALWDGVDTGKTGGTSQIVKFKMNGVPEPFSPPQRPLDTVDNGPVYHIITPRKSNPNPIGSPYELQLKYPNFLHGEQEAKEYYHAIFNNINKFNYDIQKNWYTLNKDLSRSKNNLLPDEQIEALPLHLRTIGTFFTGVDMLAKLYQLKSRNRTQLIYFLAFFSALCLEIYSNLLPQWLLLLSYLGSLGYAYYLNKRMNYLKYENKYLEYRALAEGLRIQFYWAFAGIKDDVTRYYLRKQKSDLNWICEVIRVYNISLFKSEDDSISSRRIEINDRSALILVKNYWIEGQENYYLSRHRMNKTQAQDKKAKFFLKAGISTSTVLLLLNILFNFSNNNVVLHNIIFTIGTFSLIIAAFVNSFKQKMAYGLQEKKYLWMGDFFGRAKDEFTKILEIEDREELVAQARKLIRITGKEALIENGDWVLLHRERPTEVPN